ncbi:E3 SUMO-protein ligase SIZ1 isoform X2 [Amborella trichopoda]|uniref:E3 SUMO-protein ligase SIZ1 isoform X2 n=1 Tax=Amborella trichopoda TaxID=13333 RepID=UPI0009C08EB6|nr:E3 SUMO-protein ligase SIZ1 isoform X2 [Amborella trichopoda]|eukprot:XP_020518728.1 E3 SUMO-protein ligase SIZ1 isoform X2 [Amborella trichopoda]
MDLLSRSKDKLSYFRIKELKDVLTQLGLAKQGKKQELVDRILGMLSDEQGSRSQGWGKKPSIGKEAIAKIIDDTYRKMQGHGAVDLASKGQNGTSLHVVKPKEEEDDGTPLNMNIRCPCGSSLVTDSMIKECKRKQPGLPSFAKCQDSKCHIWQHLGCVIIPEKPEEGMQPEVPAQFYCELCRINRADPFWVTMGHPLYPVRLIIANPSTDGTSPVQSLEKTFTLTRTDRELLQKPGCDLQVWSILLNDKVPFRMQWPQYTDLQINGVPVRTTNRPGGQLLGINGRDDGPAITSCSKEGTNRVTLSACDARPFCLGVRIVRRRTVNQVLNLVPKESDGERFEDALARVCRCIGGGTATENADQSDSDLEVVAESVTVNLRCPMSGSRMKVAGRFKPCVHMACFDLDTFVELNQRSRKWQCPICLKNYSLENVIIDPYFNRITTMMRDCGEDVTEIEVKPDGSWRAKNEGELKSLGQWHFPYGSPYAAANGDTRHHQEPLKSVKQEVDSETRTGLKLKLGKRNRDGHWELRRPDELPPLSSSNNVHEKPESRLQKVIPIPMTSSATGSNRDGEDPSVNQDGGGNFDFSMNNGIDIDPISPNFDPTSCGGGVTSKVVSSMPVTGGDIIVLSDSDDDDLRPSSGVPLMFPETAYGSGAADASAIPFTIPPPGGLGETSFPDDRALGLFNNSNNDDFGMPNLWTNPMPPCPPASSNFRLFGSEPDVSVDPLLVDVHQTSVVALNMPMNGYNTLGSDPQGVANDPSSTMMNNCLDDNPLAFGADDPSLQLFLPSQPAGAVSDSPSNYRDRGDMSNGVHTEDWISLSLGGSGSHMKPGPTTSRHSKHQFAPEEGGMETLANTASLLLRMSDERVENPTPDQPGSESPFSFHRPSRSSRSRQCLSIDTDSE